MLHKLTGKNEEVVQNTSAVEKCRTTTTSGPKFEVEPYSITGPVTWEELPKSLKDDYTLNGQIQLQARFIDGRTRSGALKMKWTKEEIDVLVAKAKARTNMGPYGLQASLNIYAALDAHSDIKGARALVVGTRSPWIESILHVYGARELVTVDFNPLELDYPGWMSVSIRDLNRIGCCFDWIVSFSSLEHDGLGRYGGE
eukprot:scaffold18.g2017.t1